jgi:hypothetical protein
MKRRNIKRSIKYLTTIKILLIHRTREKKILSDKQEREMSRYFIKQITRMKKKLMLTPFLLYFYLGTHAFLSISNEHKYSYARKKNNNKY